MCAVSYHWCCAPSASIFAPSEGRMHHIQMEWLFRMALSSPDMHQAGAFWCIWASLFSQGFWSQAVLNSGSHLFWLTDRVPFSLLGPPLLMQTLRGPRQSVGLTQQQFSCFLYSTLTSVVFACCDIVSGFCGSIFSMTCL